jgi:hypothetical protein
MKLFQNEISKLQKINSKKGTKVSIYLPTHPQSSGGNLQADQIRFKNAIQDISAKLPKHESDLHSIVKKLETLHDDSDFWRHQSLGLAVFATKQSLSTIKLPIEVTATTHINDAFLLSSLLLANDLQYSALLLDINLEKPRIFKADVKSIEQIEEFAPKSMKDLMEEDYEGHQQFYSPAGDRAGTPMYHGHGGSDDHAIEEITLYLRYLVQELKGVMQKNPEPLLLAGEKHRLSQMTPLLKDFTVLEEQLTGNHQHRNKNELHELARTVLVEKAHSSMDAAQSEIMESKRTVRGLNEIFKALKRKAVAKLYVPALRETSDSVRAGYQQSLLLETEASEQFESLINETKEQGGIVQAVMKDSLRDNLPHAIIRF